MAATDPIKIGSAAGQGLTLTGATSHLDPDNWIQAYTLTFFLGDQTQVETIRNSTFRRGQNYALGTFISSDFRVDELTINHKEGGAAEFVVIYKRPDPNNVGRSSAVVNVDTVINYKTILSESLFQFIFAADQSGFPSIYGFPEPIVTVTYNNLTRPPISGGTIASIYAQPGSSRAQNFPDYNGIDIPLHIPVRSGQTVGYWDGSAIQTVNPNHNITLNYTLNFDPNPLGWQLQKLKIDEVSNYSFYDIEEQWRGSYFYSGVTFQGITSG